MSNTSFSWMYRDASNYKTSECVVLEGTLTEDEIKRMKARLEDGEFFIPGQVGLKDLQDSFEGCESSWDPDLDHVFHTIVEIDQTDLPPTLGAPTAKQLLARFETVEWDATYEPPFYDEMLARYEARQEESEAEENPDQPPAPGRG